MSQIFREKSLKNAQSPEQLDEIIEVNKPYVWIALVAALVLLGGFLIWAIFGSIPTTLAVKVLVDGERGVIYLDAEKKEGIEIGAKIKLNGKEFLVSSVADKPISREDVEKQINDPYIFEKMSPSAWCIAISLEAKEVKNGIYDAKITVSETKAISFIFN